jgi:DNA-directed RNA polymerase alpha subunit
MTDRVAPNMRAQPIEVLGLSARPLNALLREGVRTVGDLTTYTATDITDLRNLGMLTLAEVQAKLGEHGLALSDGDAPRSQP